jgi:hypothetical protein
VYKRNLFFQGTICAGHTTTTTSTATTTKYQQPCSFLYVLTPISFSYPISQTSQTKIADLVQIVPEDFEKDASLAIEDNINAKYANKVIQKIGLCICLYDLLSASEGLIGHGTGLVNVNGKCALTRLLIEQFCNVFFLKKNDICLVTG